MLAFVTLLLMCFCNMRSLGGNSLGSEGGKAIAEAHDANKTLKVLNMSGNEIEDKDLRKKCRSRKM